MGTRHLIKVISNGETKVAQYGQWDGYPSGAGVDIARFLETVNLDKFKEAVDNCSFVSSEFITELLAPYSNAEGWMTFEESMVVKERFPEFHRDTSAGVLWVILQRNGCKLYDDSEFESDTLFCEWVYTIDLDNETVTMSDNGDNVWVKPINEFTVDFCEGIEW